jgi:hypothetical protein
MPNPENIAAHKFKKGQTGNPNGRPRKLPIIDDLLAEVLGDEQNGETIAKAILTKLSKKAIAGDVRAAEIILDRAYGKSKQAIDLKGQLDIATPYSDSQVDKILNRIREASKIKSNRC